MSMMNIVNKYSDEKKPLLTDLEKKEREIIFK